MTRTQAQIAGLQPAPVGRSVNVLGGLGTAALDGAVQDAAGPVRHARCAVDQAPKTDDLRAALPWLRAGLPGYMRRQTLAVPLDPGRGRPARRAGGDPDLVKRRQIKVLIATDAA